MVEYANASNTIDDKGHYHVPAKMVNLDEWDGCAQPRPQHRRQLQGLRPARPRATARDEAQAPPSPQCQWPLPAAGRCCLTLGAPARGQARSAYRARAGHGADPRALDRPVRPPPAATARGGLRTAGGAHAHGVLTARHVRSVSAKPSRIKHTLKQNLVCAFPSAPRLRVALAPQAMTTMWATCSTWPRTASEATRRARCA